MVLPFTSVLLRFLILFKNQLRFIFRWQTTNTQTFTHYHCVTNLSFAALFVTRHFTEVSPQMLKVCLHRWPWRDLSLSLHWYTLSRRLRGFRKTHSLLMDIIFDTAWKMSWKKVYFQEKSSAVRWKLQNKISSTLLKNICKETSQTEIVLKTNLKIKKNMRF